MFVKEDKYIVIKKDDVSQLSEMLQSEFLGILETIDCHRHDLGKKYNHYVVVNEDEPYSNIIWRLIELGEKFKI